MTIFVSLIVFFLFPWSCFAGQWVNPKEVIGDPMIARLQNGRQELTEVEREDIARYGYTGLELMTYLDDNKDPGRDFEFLFRRIHLEAGGHRKIFAGINLRKYYYQDYRALITYEGIKPGDIKSKFRGIAFYPPGMKGAGGVIYSFLRDEIDGEEEMGWRYIPDLRKVTRRVAGHKEDNFVGTVITNDDRFWREPWEEDHKILGEDILSGQDCLVVESINHNPDYYLSKRVTWIDKKNFTDYHEEQFDREGRLYKIIDRKWIQVEPWNYWVKETEYYFDTATKGRTLTERSGWLFDQNPPDRMFHPKQLLQEKPWRRPPKSLFEFKTPAQFPREPQIRSEFWEKIGIKVEVKKID
jgi:hypothetical protein